jgi:hypothetical protein
MAVSVFVTVKYRLDNICDQEDIGPGEPFETLDDLVRNLISDEGIAGLATDEGEVVSIREAK